MSVQSLIPNVIYPKIGDVEMANNNAVVESSEGGAQSQTDEVEASDDEDASVKEPGALTDEFDNEHVNVKTEMNGSEEQSKSPVDVKEEEDVNVGALMSDMLTIMREHRPLCFFDEEFVVPAYQTSTSLAEKYKASFTLPQTPL